MTVLRSRVILPAATQKSSKPPSRGNAVFEPVTPSRSSEFLIQSSRSVTPRSILSNQKKLGLGTVRRRSARLAGKIDMGERKEIDVRDLDVKGMDLETGVEEGNRGEEVKVESGYDSGSGFDAAEAVNDGGRKRKFRMETRSLGFESSEEDGVEEKVMGFRSGKRVVKREIEDDLEETGLEASMEEDDNLLRKEKGVGRGEKGKGKAGFESPVDFENLSESADLKEVAKDEGVSTTQIGVRTRGRLSAEEKAKMKLSVDASSSDGINITEPEMENVSRSSVAGTNHSAVDEALPVADQVRKAANGAQAREANENAITRARYMREYHQDFARQNARRFAHFSSQDKLNEYRAMVAAGASSSLPAAQTEVEDWPGPFSTAMKIITDRGTNKSGARHGASTGKSETVELKWIPKKQESCKKSEKQVPSLQELCLSVLAKNADAISSLDFVPDSLRHKISWFLCDGRRMSGEFLELLVSGSPTEIRVRDCSWLSEELFTKIFEGVDASKLTVFQFDQCGSCLPDYALYATLCPSSNFLPALTMISLKGAYRLTDAGLNILVSAAPSLKSINISQCPIVTSEGIFSLTNSLRAVLRELYLDYCHGIDAMLILPELLELKNLEILSVAGIETVCDDFVGQFISVNGCRMKELVLADCLELTDVSLKAIGDNCTELRAIDLTNLSKLTDASIGHLANGCQAIEMLKACRNAFSDEAIAAYLDVRGASLKDLSLNNIMQVSNHTALSLARNCRNLWRLDLSWCRKLTDDALGLIVDSCSSLELLRLFGCTQVTNVFLDGHSNPRVKLIGSKMTSVFKHLDVPDFLQGSLRYSSISP